VPCLQHCHRFRRAVGFFSSSALSEWADVLPSVVINDYLKIQLLISPNLSEMDLEALRHVATQDERDLIYQQLSDGIAEEAMRFAQDPSDTVRRIQLMTWMIASGKLELRFAFPEHVDQPGIYHEKIGVFTFSNGDEVAFTGSANESAFGYSGNYECLDVFRSWVPSDVQRVRIKSEQFDAAWCGEASGLHVAQLSPATLAQVKERATSNPNGDTDAPKDPKWRHQDEAIEVFLNTKRGILEMATGTGKTRTAIEILSRLLQEDLVQSILIAADGNDLLDQWYMSVSPLANRHSFSITRRYGSHADHEAYAINPKHRIHLCSRQQLARTLSALPTSLMPIVALIHDEVHRLGSPGNCRDLAGLADGIVYRLGLSATPEREYDDDGNNFIDNHIGPTIYEFTLEQAISRGILAPFNYHPLEWTASADDRANIQLVYKQVAARKASGNPMKQEDIWMRIASVYKTSETKLPLFRKFLRQNPELIKRSIIFVATHEYAEHILPHVHDLTLKYHTYFDGDDKDILRKFAHGELECLITCHRLSEGIDIQSIRNVFLLSADRARLETIQRIGRCLRVDSNDSGKVANVIDFIRCPAPDSKEVSPDMARQDWLANVSKFKSGVDK
jgi:superfamily II DNA or RNA helicase